MNQNRQNLFAKALVLLVACGSLVLAGSVLLMPAGDAIAIEGCPNPSCGPTQYTPTVTGVSGVDCLWAKMDANSKAQTYVSCGPDGICLNQLEIVEPCELENGVWIFRARVRYQCASCF